MLQNPWSLGLIRGLGLAGLTEPGGNQGGSSCYGYRGLSFFFQLPDGGDLTEEVVCDRDILKLVQEMYFKPTRGMSSNIPTVLQIEF